MTLYVITYDVRKKYPDDYKSLYALLNEWGAAHLQNSVWLANMDGGADAVRDALLAHTHQGDTVCVIELAAKPKWATQSARKSGNDWLKSLS